MMKKNVTSKIFFTLVALVLILTAGIKAYGEQNVDEVPYEKWSQIALSAAKEKYPNSQLIDYKYVKREEVNAEESKDIFHIKVKQNNEQFIVSADVVFNPKTAKLITVKVEKLADAPGL